MRFAAGLIVIFLLHERGRKESGPLLHRCLRAKATLAHSETCDLVGQLFAGPRQEEKGHPLLLLINIRSSCHLSF